MRAVFLTAALLSCMLLSGSERPVVKDGKSEYVIIHGTDTGVPKRAALDLQTYIFKATGAKLPIVPAAKRGGRPAFLVGLDKVTVPEGFIVKTQGRDIRISGNDTPGQVENAHWATGARTGTWYGVCDFLEKQLGIRWFMPGELGEYVPERRNWSVPDLDYADHPEMEKRDMHYLSGGPRAKQEGEPNLFRRRNRLGRANSWQASHSWLHHLPAKKYFKDHPEWFAFVGGRRYSYDALGMGLQLCTTNQEALDELAKNLILHRKRWKTPIMLSLSPNDGGNHCECPKCQALDDGVRPDGSRITTTRMMTYANAMAERINKVLPDQTFGMYAYGNYTEGVGKVKINPHITIMEVNNDTGITYYDPRHRAQHLNNLKAWRRNLNKLYFYSTPESMGNLELPCYHFENIRMLFDNLKKAGVTGIDMNNGSGFGASGLNNYFYARFAWRPPADAEAFYNTTLEECYGKEAAPVMKGYFADVEKRMAEFATKRRLDSNRELGYIRRLPGVLKSTYTGLAEKWLPRLRAAAGKTRDRGQKARISIAAANLEYCRLTVALYRAALKVVGRTTPKKEDVVAADKLARERLAAMKKMAASPSNIAPERILHQEKHHRIPFDTKIFEYMLIARNRKTAEIRYLNTAPEVDGDLGDDFWKDLPVYRIDLAKDDGSRFKTGADVKLAASGGDLYIGIRCEEPLMDAVNDSARGPKAAVWNENSLDLFFNPPGGKGYCQLVFNSIASVRMFRHVPKARAEEMTGIAEVKTRRGGNFWSAEVRIPLRALSGSREFRGDIWGMNFCRTRRTVNPAEYSCWSPTFGDFHKPARFGKAVFK